MTKKLVAALLCMASIAPAIAGGMLTNTNQNVAFLRNPARDGAIGIDGVYSNPAGVAFLNEGIHLSLNWQAAFQKRNITTTSPMFALGAKNNGATTKEFEGKASAPFVPSVQAAYNKDKWSFQFGFAIQGGGGKCEFSNGLGSFETAVPAIGKMISEKTAPLSLMGVPVPSIVGYDADIYMQGKQYYFGFQLGSAYKINEHLSVYGGLRILYGSATYNAKIENIKIMGLSNGATTPQAYSLNEYFGATGQAITGTAMTLAQAAAAAQATGNIQAATEYAGKATALQAAGQALASEAETYAIFSDGVKLLCDQSAVGVAPIISADYKIGNFNFAAKYEFRARMNLKNKSDLRQAVLDKAPDMMKAKLEKFVDGGNVREDQPALLAVGAQYSPIEKLRINASYHHFYDTDAKRYNNEQKLLDGGTNEYLGGVEYDVTDKLTLSGGVQVTKYGNTDAFINDISFVVDSWSFGVGLKYKVSDKVSVNAAYFQTNYGDYTQSAPAVTNVYTRSNNVGAVGVDFTF